MYYYSKKSRKKIIHTGDCFHIHNSDINNIGCFETLSEAHEKGYRLCKHCSPLRKHYRKESNEIVEFCRRNGLSIQLGNRCIAVTSPRSRWKIAIDNQKKIALYHQNTFKTSKDHLSEIKGYHRQKDVLKNSVVAYLHYIVKHDYYRMQNPVYMPESKKETPPPKKGTKRYKRDQQRIEKYERKQAIKNVLKLIDSLNISPAETSAMAL